MTESKRVFLSAEWRDLVMLNYEVDPALLSQYVPPGTSLDSFQGKTYVSLVGFRFCRTKLLGRFPIPFHANFDEVNLRFYVRRKEDGEERRGVVFIAEVVPRRAIATTARALYSENYVCLPTKHRIESSGTVEYLWRVDGEWCRISVTTSGLPRPAADGSLEQFITEHYWGYSRQQGGGSMEYRVEHVPWKVWAATEARFEGNVSALYGEEFAAVVQRRPESALVADGSSVLVFRGRQLI
jgi:uncharacterized protein YqjF (DUF2071 family)